jgi:dTDP-4-dehydrorhamnose reductase
VVVAEGNGGGWNGVHLSVKNGDDRGMEEMKTLVVGASGQVGTQMLGALGERALATSRDGRDGWLDMDLAELSELGQVAELLDELPLNAIYCVGGMTYVDGCEADPEVARRTNAVGPGVLAAYAHRLAVPYVYFSTEYVFDGAAEDPGPYAEDARTNPLSAYGKSKLEGEQRVMEANPQALVLRTTVVYGPDSREKNYLYGLMRNLAAGTTMKVPEDQVSTPTYNRDLIAAAMALVAAGDSGVWHVAGPELLGRLEFAQEIAARLGLDASLMEGVATARLGQPAARPLAAGLSTEKLRARHPELRMRTVAESLEDCMPELERFLELVRGQA